MYKNKLFRKIDKNCLYLEDRIKDMDAQGIQKQVLSIIPFLFCYEVPSNDLYQVAEFINKYLSSCVDQYPDSFSIRDITYTGYEIIFENDKF